MIQQPVTESSFIRGDLSPSIDRTHHRCQRPTDEITVGHPIDDPEPLSALDVNSHYRFPWHSGHARRKPVWVFPQWYAIEAGLVVEHFQVVEGNRGARVSVNDQRNGDEGKESNSHWSACFKHVTITTGSSQTSIVKLGDFRKY